MNANIYTNDYKERGKVFKKGVRFSFEIDGVVVVFKR